MQRAAAMCSQKIAVQVKRGSTRRCSSGLDNNGNMDLGTALETIVGARVGVWWDEDETFYKVCTAQAE